MDPDEYRDALRRFASGVTIVTTSAKGETHGMTATSFASVSLVPPLILVSLKKGSRTHELVLASGRFGVNILARAQEEIARRFSQPGSKSFEDIPHHLDGDVPILDEAITNLVCRTTDVVPGGDHDVFIAEVLSTGSSPGPPLLYYNRDYRSLEGS